MLKKSDGHRCGTRIKDAGKKPTTYPCHPHYVK